MDRTSLRQHLPSGVFVALAATIVLLLGVLLVYVGAYDIAADAPHTRPVYALLDTLRARSIAVRAWHIRHQPIWPRRNGSRSVRVFTKRCARAATSARASSAANSARASIRRRQS